MPEDATEDKLIKAYAKYDRVFYVYFHTKEQGNEDDAIYRTRKENPAEIDVDAVELTSLEAPYAFVGWVNEDGDPVTGTVTITDEDIHLYPDIRPGVTVTLTQTKDSLASGGRCGRPEVVIPKVSR